ncbi:hypothetical protein HPB51_014583 [Rhipicephalus microplus]|uniref:DH domain-containing protein n=1 Tax=Rhipicephalus microplus TaxID=6941 RepID=A0A9J6F3B0_RHIMP|nr:hypothetical protein HPB51_014583 [Rhipicephalus microplus]
MKLRLEAFRNLQLAFLGFADDERQHMEEVALANGAQVVEPTDPGCNFLVVDDSNPVAPVVPSDISHKAHVVKSEAPVAAATPLRSSTGAPRSESKRRKLRESLAQQLAQEAEQSVLVDPFSPESPRHRRRVSANKSITILDITLSPDKQLSTVLDTEGQENKEPSDLTRMSKRQQVCLELLQTETNYVAILHSILTLFKAPLEDPSSMPGEPLLDPAEVRLIFGHLPPIYEVHRSLQLQLQAMLRTWTDDHSIGEAVLKHREAFEKAYPPFVNSFERAKETLSQCDRQRPRFHAFLKGPVDFSPGNLLTVLPGNIIKGSLQYFFK